MTDDEALSAKDFSAFFQAIWGVEPFPWQQRLIGKLAHGKPDGCPWPDALKLPTGSGKTAALDIAIFHLALEAGRGELRHAPVRIAYVVDRRLIVDDTFARAERLCMALRWSLLDQATAEVETVSKNDPTLLAMARRICGEPIVRRVAQRLQRFSGEAAPPLLARALRGGAPREDDWARTPAQPTILCSTVDQVGSRLLFRGYGVNDRMRPIHAGLLGSDCLILLDEAHLSEPFRQTLSAIEHLPRPDKAPFGFAVLSATPAFEPQRPFDLEEEDTKHPVLAARLRAPKPAHLTEIAGKQGVDTESRRAEAIAAATMEVLEALRRDPIGMPAIGVVVNRVVRARVVYERLRQLLPEQDYDMMLLIGPTRCVDRDGHAERLDVIHTGRHDARAAMERPLIVVATQTIEAGVDIDFDGLVTEAAALDALRQRFGRLNRAGREIEARAVVLAHREDVGKKANDPVYGDRITTTWEALQRWKSDERVDFSINAMNGLLGSEDAFVLKTLMTEPGNAPVLMPAFARLWSQTCVIPRDARKGTTQRSLLPVEPEIDLFLHGNKRVTANVQIVWRADLTPSDFVAEPGGESIRERLIELLGFLPPRSAEAVEVPITAARAWLRQAGKLDFSDAIELARDEDESGSGRPAFRYAGAESERTEVIFPQDVRPGDLIVVPSTYGGCDEWGWNPNQRDVVTDVAAGAARPYRARRFTVRVAPALIAQGLREEKKQGDAPVDPDIDGAAIADKLAKCLADSNGPPDTLLEAILDLKRLLPKALRQDLQRLRKSFNDEDQWEDSREHRRPGHLVCAFPYGDDSEGRPSGVVFFARAGIDVEDSAMAIQEAAIPSTESDDFNTMIDGSVSLEKHSTDVADWADFFAKTSGLDEDQRHDMVLAAYLHDLGKSDLRYQAYYAGGDPYGPEASEVLAKSGRRLSREAWKHAGLPQHWRHEAASVCLAMGHPAFGSAKDPALVLWLIGTHHGFGRPHFPHADDDKNRIGPQSLAFRFQQMDWASLFADLQRKYGTWGLARFEAFVRLADHRGSDSMICPPKRDATPWACSFNGNAKSTGIVVDSEPSTRLRLEGLEPDNLLAFLCLLGMVRAIEEVRPEWQPRVAWDLGGPPLRPILCLAQPQEERAVSDVVAEGVFQLAAAYRFPVDATPDAPAQKDLNYSSQTARELLKRAATRKDADLWSALMCDAAHKDEKIEATPFCLLFGQGHQHFLDRLADVPRIEAPPPHGRGKKTVMVTAAETLREALFQPWMRQDPTPAFRWDPNEDVRYALRADDPSRDKSTTQHGANRLAAIGLATLPVVPIRRGDRIRLQVPGGRFERNEFFFSWPIWRHSASLSAIRALLAHPGLIEESISTLIPLGVVEVYRTRRISVGKFMNFTRAETIMIRA